MSKALAALRYLMLRNICSVYNFCGKGFEGNVRYPGNIEIRNTICNEKHKDMDVI